MNRRARSDTRKAAAKPILTAGEVFDDGVAIELVRGSAGSSKPALLLWDGTVAALGPQVGYRGQTYESPEIPKNVYRAVLLPSRCGDCGPLRQLYDEVTAVFATLNFSDGDSRLLAAFCMMTWLADFLPIAPSVVISGSDHAAGVEVLRCLRCLCRHALLLAELTPGSYRSLPLQLSLTLLLDQTELKPAMSRLLCASSYRGVCFSGGRGTVIDPYGPKAIFGGSELGDRLIEGSIRISMAPAQFPSHTLNENACRVIADNFQPRLLHFRLKNYSATRSSSVEAPGFTSETLRLAWALGACLPADPEFAREVVELLRPQDDNAHEERLCAVECVLVEVLWGLIHRGAKREISVAELAEEANALLRSRGEILVYSSEEVGWRLRALGVSRHSSAAGRRVVLDRDTRRQVHVLARSYDLTCARSVMADCPECARPSY